MLLDIFFLKGNKIQLGLVLKFIAPLDISLLKLVDSSQYFFYICIVGPYRGNFLECIIIIDMYDILGFFW